MGDSTLILLRHGESEWNEKNLFTGWVDVDLTEKGRTEAARAGDLIKDLDRQPGVQLDEAAVIAFVAERVSPHKKVRRVEFIDLVPKSAAGKILRKDLRASEAGRS